MNLPYKEIYQEFLIINFVCKYKLYNIKFKVKIINIHNTVHIKVVEIIIALN